ncbi:MAG: ABC transporter substrate-binding protein [Streptosporangiales bacterium]
MFRPHRIALLATITALLAGTAACGGGGPNPAGPPGGSKVVVGSWGGDYENFQKRFVLPLLEKQQNAPNPVFDTADQGARMTKMRTQGDSKTGTMDVTELSDIDMQKMIDAGLMTKLDPKKIPNWSHIPKNLRNPYWIPHIYSGNVICYNKNKVKPAPTSFKALWDPKYKGKIGIQTIQWDDFYHAAATLATGGHPRHNWAKGVPKLKQLADNVQVFGSQEQLGQGLQSGQVWLTLDWKARAYQWNKGGGAPIGSVVPEEGTFPIIFAAGIPKNAPHKEAAYKYLNAMLAPSAQRDFAKNMGYSPTVDNAELPGKLKKALSFTPAEEKKIKPLDAKWIAKTDERWHRIWKRQIVNH